MRKVGILVFYIAYIYGSLHVLQYFFDFLDHIIRILDVELLDASYEFKNYTRIIGGIFFGFLIALLYLIFYFLMSFLRVSIFGSERTFYDTPSTVAPQTTRSILIDAIAWPLITILFLLIVAYLAPVKADIKDAPIAYIAHITAISILIAFIALRRGFFIKPYSNHDGDERYKANLFAVHIRSTYAMIALCALVTIVETSNIIDMFIGTWFIFLLMSFHSFNKIFLFWFELRDEQAT